MPENQPDFILKLNSKDPNGDFNERVGAGWYTKFGGISITLNPGIVLSYETIQDFFLILAKTNHKKSDKKT